MKIIISQLTKHNAVLSVLIGIVGLFSSLSVTGQDISNGADNFYQSNNVTMQQAAFKHQYNMTVAGNLFISQGMDMNTKKTATIVWSSNESSQRTKCKSLCDKNS